MTIDPYEALNLTSAATEAEIKKAYRRIARTDHPDLNPDDPAAEARFKAASAAHDLLKDPATRARFDRGEIDADGAQTAARSYYRDAAGPGDGYSRGGFAGAGGGFDASGTDPEDFFARFARGAGRSRGDPFGSGRLDMPGQDHRYTLSVPFLDAVRGARTRISLPDGGNLAVTIPEGATDGLTLRLRGKGGPGVGEGPAGDAYVTLSVEEDAQFRREGDDIRSTLDVGIDEAVLGAKVPVRTIDGEVLVALPRGASSGRVVRLRGRGVRRRGADARGDHLVEVRIVLPPEIDDDLRRFMEDWRKTHAHDPRDRKARP